MYHIHLSASDTIYKVQLGDQSRSNILINMLNSTKQATGMMLGMFYTKNEKERVWNLSDMYDNGKTEVILPSHTKTLYQHLLAIMAVSITLFFDTVSASKS